MHACLPLISEMTCHFSLLFIHLHFCTYNFYMLSALPKVYPNNLQGRNRFFYNRIYTKCGPQDLKVYMPLSVIVPKSDVIFLAYI